MNNNTLHARHLLKNGEYRIIETLGQGGFGITYLAEQTALGRRVAVKEFFMKENCYRDEQTSRVSVPPTGSRELVEKFRHKFLREARMIAALDNPHIVRIYDVFEENGTAYYVMEHLDGGSLTEEVRQSGPMPQNRALEYIRQVADALAYLHGQNILHFDVKPSNILVGKSGQAVLIDFGISKHYDEAGSQTSSTPVGISKGYAPMEQYQQGEISTFTPATDIYSLGATLYFLLIGQTPPSASEVNEDGLPQLPNSVSPAVQHAIVHAMASRRKDRPQTVKEFLALISEIEVMYGGPETDEKKINIDIEPVIYGGPADEIYPLDEEDEETVMAGAEKKRKRDDYIAPITYTEALKSACKNIFNFSGRANRCEFWCAGITLLPFCLFFLYCSLYFGVNYFLRISLLGSAILVILFLTLSLEIRRLHDCGRSGWWALIFNLPLLIWGMAYVFLLEELIFIFLPSLFLSLYITLKFFLAPSKEKRDRRKTEIR